MDACQPRDVTEVNESALGVTRRSTLKLLAAGLASIGLSSLATPALAAAKTYKVCKTTDIKIGSAKIFAVNGLPVVITQPKKGVFKAFNGYCTHQGAPLAAGVGAVATQGTNMFCFQHGASFNTTSGAATGGPANRPLAKITATVAGTQVSVTL
jgi:nitrite reductase/ring-hydroxylating ferredoxin subunit